MVHHIYDIRTVNTLVIGSGAAGLNAAIHFVEEGGDSTQINIITEKLGGGTSFNAGSDKQTYYKLSLSGSIPDSIFNMAETYWIGGSMHGDIALVEAANSVREFMHLISLGVPFPTNKYGEYVGYKTDNDPLQRATSAGPLTSKAMSECLLKRVNELEISIFDNHYCCKILDLSSKKIVIAFKIENIHQTLGPDLKDGLRANLVLFVVDNLIVATGGSSAIYEHSVYPTSQWGSLGLLIDYGCETQNLTESQFGLASTSFRWNVSGSYQQVIPTYLSAGDIKEINSATEFLNPHFPNHSKLLNATFLKGYQWPFNIDRIKNYGSSLIDLLVYKEVIENHRIVFLDYTKNPNNLSINEILESLDDDFAKYLTNSGIKPISKYDQPVMRLKKINPKAYQLYLSQNIDLSVDPLLISVCAQHCNGGIAGDLWWESNKPGVFVIGEANGSHGVHRPGGAALNAGQVGGLRASLKIIHRYYKTQKRQSKTLDLSKIATLVEDYINKLSLISMKPNGNVRNPEELFSSIKYGISKYGTIIRSFEGLHSHLDSLEKQFSSLYLNMYFPNPKISDVLYAMRVYDAFLTQIAYLKSIQIYLINNGGSRGSYLVKKSESFLDTNPQLNEFVIKTKWNGADFIGFLEKVRDIPRDENWFESIWNEYENGSWIN